MVIALLSQMQLCPGNDGFQDLVQQRRQYSQEDVTFRGPDGQEARSNGNIIRHLKCHGLVVDGLCDVCKTYRSSLRKIRSRENENQDQQV